MVLALKSFFLVFVFGWISLKLAQRYVCETPKERALLGEHAKTIGGLLPLAFFSNNFWLYLGLSAAWVYWRRQKHPTVAAYLASLFCLPVFLYNIPGFGPFGYLIDLKSCYGFSALAWWWTWQSERAMGRASRKPRASLMLGLDYMVLGWVLLPALRYGWLMGPTESFRHLFYTTMDFWVPYYVVSRGLAQLPEREWAIKVFVSVCVFASITAAFEAGKGWLLFAEIPSSMGAYRAFGNYLMRDGTDILRAQFSTGQPIVLGMMIGAGFLLSLTLRDLKSRMVLLSILGLGVLAPVSRGPWVCLVIGLAAWAIAPPFSGARFVQMVGSCLGTAVLILISPMGEKIINVLPWIGTAEKFNVEYRERLIDVSLMLFWDNPVFGTPNYIGTSLMQTMIQGEGIVDLVNTYLTAALSYGAVGASFYSGIFLLSIWYAVKVCRQGDATQAQPILAAAVFCATCVATVANITQVPLIWLMVAGMSGSLAIEATSTKAAKRRQRTVPPHEKPA